MAGTMKDVALMMPQMPMAATPPPNPIIPIWGQPGQDTTALQQSWTKPLPTTTPPSQTFPNWGGNTIDGPNKWGDKNVAEWFRDQGLSVTDKGGLDALISQLEGYQSPTNPRGDPNNPFHGGPNKYYPIYYHGSSSDPYDGSKATIHDIEDGMSEREKAMWRQSKYQVPEEIPGGSYQGQTGRGDRYLNWPG